MSKNGKPVYCFSVFGSIFCVLFCLLIKTLILGCDTIWQSMRKFLWAVWSVSAFPHMDKENYFFFENCTLVWSGFLYLFIRPEDLNLKISENLTALTLLGEKVSTSAESKWYIWYMYTLWLCITLGYMPKSLVT